MLKKDLSILFDERGPRSGCSTGMAMPKPKRNLRDRSPKVITTGKLPQQNKPNKPYPILRGRRRISCPFQASHLAARRGARTAHSPATQPTKQRSMVARGQHQMGKLFFADPLSLKPIAQPELSTQESITLYKGRIIAGKVW